MDLVPPTDKAQRPAVRVDLNPVPLVLAAWSSVLAAHLIATAGGPHWRLLGFQLLVSGCLFVAGSLLAQCSGDRSGHGDGLGASPPERPGSRFRCWALGYGLLAAGLVTALVAGPGVLWVAAPLALSFVAWSANRRSGPASAITYGLVHWFNWLLGMSAGILLLPELLLALPVLLYASAAELTRRAELAPHRRRAVRSATIVLGLALAAAVLLYPLGILQDPYALTLTALTGALLMRRLLRLMLDPTQARVRASADFMLLCMIPLHALLLGGDGQRLPALALLLLMLPSWFLSWHRHQPR
jgi:hypothetical protein